MLETNIRIVYPGAGLYIWTRKAVASGSSLSPDLLEKACNRLRRKYGIAAMKFPGEQDSLLVAVKAPIDSMHLEDQDWEMDVKDIGEASRKISFSDPFGKRTIPTLIERTVLSAISKRKEYWTIDSPRIFYDKDPIEEQDGVSVYRRYEVSALEITGVGVGIAVDVSTAFFTTESLAYFFDPKVDAKEKKWREEAFIRFAGRQVGQKGTLLYDNGRSRVKCYFEKVIPGETCSTTGVVRVANQRYDSVLEYYKANYPNLPVNGDTLAIRVSFPGLDKGLPVAADRVKIRVMNDDVPDSLNAIDKIHPFERRKLLDSFWLNVGVNPLAGIAPGLLDGYWRPDSTHVAKIQLPNLLFGGNQVLGSPNAPTSQAYRNNFRQRVKLLDESKCYSVPPTMSRTIYCACPSSIGQEAQQKLALSIVEQIRKWTNVNVSAQIVSYQTVVDAVEKLRGLDSAGVAVFILNEEPVAYYDAAFMLPGWRIKRITDRTLQKHYEYVEKGWWDRKIKAFNQEKGKRQWESFITMNSLALLYLLDVVPFRVQNLGTYEAQLAIDVGHDRRFSAISLTVVRQENETPPFLSRSEVYNKPDTQHEMINPILLSDQISGLFDTAFRKSFSPLNSLLILRDGQMSDNELVGINQAIAHIKSKGYLLGDAKVDVADVHKDSAKAVRLWEASENDVVENPLEGTMIRLNNEAVILATTGSATLHQGTAEPLLLRSNGNCSNLEDVAKSVFMGSQLNWFSPTVAQRLPLALKITDDELVARSAQEIRRLR